MSLSPLDDYPVHQTPDPIRRVGTSDRNFYDRYYFNVHGLDDEVCLIAGMGAYPNLGTFDAFAVLVHDDRHTVVRASRELTNDRMDTSVGPFRVEVLEGLKRLRVVLEPNEWGLHFDLTFTGSIVAHQEPRHFWRQNERIIFNTCRLAQTGRWSGSIDIADTHFDVEPERWWGCRDRSWGIRTVGEPEPPGIRAARPPSMFWSYAQIQFDDHSMIYMAQENCDGSREIEEAVRIWSDPERSTENLGRPDHDLVFTPGTRTVERGLLTMGEDPSSGKPILVDLDVGLPVHLGIGTGYGREPDWVHGMYHGPLKVEGLSVDLTAPETKERMAGVVDTVGRFEYDGNVGYGLWEYAVGGPHDRYGFESWTDGYSPRGG